MSKRTDKAILKLLTDSGYKITRNGEIWRRVGAVNPGNGGYVTVKYKGTCLLVHRVIIAKFLGLEALNYKPTVNHKNGIKFDNRLSNLELMTIGDNTRHSFAMGRKSRKLTRHDPAKIRRLARSGVEIKDIARMFDISYKHALSIVNLKRWVKNDK